MKKYSVALICVSLFLFALFSILNSSNFPVFSTKKSPDIIVIDVGHGGVDPGKVSSNGTQEKDVNLAIAKYLRDYLIAQDYTVHLTRDSDCGLYDESASNKKKSDLQNRILFFKKQNAALVVSIHQNSYSDTLQHGAQTFYYSNSESSKQLAECVQTALLNMDNTNTRQAKASDSYYLLKKSTMPAVIVECGFLSNPEECAKLTDSNYQKKIAYTISMGINAYTKSVTTKKELP